MFADFVEHLRGRTSDNRILEATPAFNAYLLWLTFPPISLLFLGKPFLLVIAYGALGAFFMPFLALTLLWLLNSGRTPAKHRNGIVSNVLLTTAGALFVILCVRELVRLV